MKNSNLLALVMLAATGLQACHNSEKKNTGASTTTIAADSTLDTVSDVAKNSDTKLSSDQTDFVQKAAVGGMAEIEASKLALQRTQSPIIKKFAQMMVTDHTKASSDLAAIAKSKGLALPGTAPVEVQKKMDALNSTQGNDAFDRQYMLLMVADHAEALTLFRSGKTSNDKDIQAYASKYLPVLQMHFQQANVISTKLEKQKMNNGDDLLNISPTKSENK